MFFVAHFGQAVVVLSLWASVAFFETGPTPAQSLLSWVTSADFHSAIAHARAQFPFVPWWNKTWLTVCFGQYHLLLHRSAFVIRAA